MRCSASKPSLLIRKQSDYQSIRLFCQDKMRYGLLPITNRRITLQGIKPVAEIDYSYASIYLYGAVEPMSGDRFFLEFPYLTVDCFQIFINQFSTTFPDNFNLIVLDNGRFHQAEILEIPDNVVLLFLPPYSPELNPIEDFGRISKQSYFAKYIKPLRTCRQKWQRYFTLILTP
ncbi:MAG: transposase [Candidatus Poribacteria bacterium]|nr:transposase [Candidatus Poribacteria bacterium]